MEKLRKTIYGIVSVVTVVVAICSLLSLFRNTESRFLKMLDFPRIQFFITSLVSLVLFVVLTKKWRWYDYALISAILGGLVIQSSYLINYTPLVATVVPDAESREYGPDNEISLLIANVKMKNRQAQPLLQLIEEYDPDLFLGMEVDDWWDEQLSPIEQRYPHVQEQVNNASYGMTLYSKYPLADMKVNYLNNEKVPSFFSTITLGNGRMVDVNTLHPVPPTHFEDLPDNAGQEEVAMTELGQRVEGTQHPTIVAGDINDVVWFNTDELTGTKDLLYDVRVGRGFYNSFDATSPILRWPLDHVFVTREFRLKKLERLSDIKSDHFPIYVELVLPPVR